MNEETKQTPNQEVSDQQMSEEETLMAAAADIEAQTMANTIDFENLKPYSVIVVKIPPGNQRYYVMMHQAIVRGILEPRMELLKGKNIGVLFMTTEDSLELLSEEDMNKAGWVRKEPSLIVKPSEFRR